MCYHKVPVYIQHTALCSTPHSFSNVGLFLVKALVMAAGRSCACSATEFYTVVYRRLSAVLCSRP